MTNTVKVYVERTVNLGNYESIRLGVGAETELSVLGNMQAVQGALIQELESKVEAWDNSQRSHNVATTVHTTLPPTAHTPVDTQVHSPVLTDLQISDELDKLDWKRNNKNTGDNAVFDTLLPQFKQPLAERIFKNQNNLGGYEYSLYTTEQTHVRMIGRFPIKVRGTQQ